MEDKELTQTSLVKHEIKTGDTEPIRQRTRPVPPGAHEEFKEIIREFTPGPRVLKDKEVFVYIDDILIATETEEGTTRKTNVAELRPVLVLCGYYRKIILNFSKMAQPMLMLTSQKVFWRWDAEQENSFNRLRDALFSTPVLAQPDVEGARAGTNPFIIYTDASQLGVRAVLCQKGKDRFSHPLNFAPKSLIKPERRKHVADMEALAVVFALEKILFFVYGMEVTMRTDHPPLTPFSRDAVFQVEYEDGHWRYKSIGGAKVIGKEVNARAQGWMIQIMPPPLETRKQGGTTRKLFYTESVKD
ncbi:hypothetical protein TELCIR_15279 [Teladorsagia circumcincta]|uniref:Reverse transcriptase/retrotransposon-derived protein RNase H-like domain-containing protein n=1 Tax=Teladorsagia circumcincta TaxID=45464 RepID=A0A2G9TYN3_TELCI|nr:hypothetical protein TELCIR_15279 [Teladorsagia circumcincta]